MQLFVMAVALGFVSSLPLGPINLYVADSVLSKESIRKFIMGVVAADATIVLAITSFDVDGTVEGIWAAIIWLISSLAIVAIAVSMLAALRLPEMGKAYSQRFSVRGKNSVWLGYAFCIANPAFWAFWFASSTMMATQWRSI